MDPLLDDDDLDWQSVDVDAALLDQAQLDLQCALIANRKVRTERPPTNRWVRLGLTVPPAIVIGALALFYWASIATDPSVGRLFAGVACSVFAAILLTVGAFPKALQSLSYGLADRLIQRQSRTLISSHRTHLPFTSHSAWSGPVWALKWTRDDEEIINGELDIQTVNLVAVGQVCCVFLSSPTARRPFGIRYFDRNYRDDVIAELESRNVAIQW